MKLSEELLNKIKVKKTEVSDALRANDLAKAEAGKKELDDLQKEYEMALEIEAEDVTNALPDPVPSGLKPVKPEAQKDSTAEFADMARHGFTNMMTEGTKATGGYTVPDDIQTRIETYRDATFSLRKLVSVENVTTQKGERTFKKRKKRTGLIKTGEAEAAQKLADIEFERQSYDIEKYSGYLAITEELLDDSDANLTETIVQDIGEEARVTDNIEILAILDANQETVKEVTGYYDLMPVVINDLGSTFANTSTLVVNDTGATWLYSLKDGDGRPLVMPDVTNAAKKIIACGPYRLTVEVIPNNDLPNAADGSTPIYVGDFKEAVRIFDRKRTTIKRSDTASVGNLNAFAEDLQLFKPVMRADYVIRDKEAYRRCKVTKETLKAAGIEPNVETQATEQQNAVAQEKE
uniref:Major capsid protein n=1 Tax=Siphoviridae sp. cteEJ17 TaxID=2827904 RepID=A0A8S5T1M8_9CAUD|nr:MAG TPA: major capsid protein [Siphoviridae sp. cteEJ17]